MCIKDGILKILNKKGLKYSDIQVNFNIQHNTNLTEKDIDGLIEDKNIKVLEWISKELGIPLYSFYIIPEVNITKCNRHYVEDIWKKD